MQQITDLRVGGYVPLVVPNAMKAEMPMSAAAEKTVVDGRKAVEGILKREDKRLLVIVGPCSIHVCRAADLLCCPGTTWLADRPATAIADPNLRIKAEPLRLLY